MKLPIDTSGIRFFVGVPPVPVLDFDTKRPKVDENGQAVHEVQLCAVMDGKADALAVKFAGAPGLLNEGTPVRIVGMVATPWAKGDRSGVSFRAAAVEAAVPAGRNGSAADKG